MAHPKRGVRHNRLKQVRVYCLGRSRGTPGVFRRQSPCQPGKHVARRRRAPNGGAAIRRKGFEALANRRDKPSNRVYAPERRYVGALWTGWALIQGCLVTIFSSGWMGPGFTDSSSLWAWLLFDIVLSAGCLQGVLFRVSTDATGIEYLTWYFRRRRWAWDEVTRVERREYSLFGLRGVRYRISAGRERFVAATFALEDVEDLAETIIDLADLDDLGEREVPLQQGTVHVWASPGADEEEW